MARVLDPETAWGPQATRGALHDWAKYCDGQVWELKRGVDLDAGASMNSARSSFRQWCKRNSYDTRLVRTGVPDDETLRIQVIGGDAAKVSAGESRQ